MLQKSRKNHRPARAANVFKKANGKCGDFWGSALNLYHHIPTLPETHMASEKWMVGSLLSL